MYLLFTEKLDYVKVVLFFEFVKENDKNMYF